MLKILLLIVLLASPWIVYFLILRPRLQMKFTEFYADVDGFWTRLWARVYALRSFMIYSAGALAAAIPELLQWASLMDFSFLPEPWPAFVMSAVGFAITLNRVYSTLPGNEKA